MATMAVRIRDASSLILSMEECAWHRCASGTAGAATSAPVAARATGDATGVADTGDADTGDAASVPAAGAGVPAAGGAAHRLQYGLRAIGNSKV